MIRSAPDRPLIVFGVPRSGTTVLHRALCQHQDLAWLSGFASRYPRWPQLNGWLMDMLAWPLVGPRLAGRFRAWEGYRFWEYYAPGFRRPQRDLTAADLTSATQARLRRAVASLGGRRQGRVLLKVTGWPRLGFLHALFPDACFIHLIRDGRAVASSLSRAPFWRGADGPASWRWPLSEDQERRWQTVGTEPVALAGLQWELLLAAAEQAISHLPAGRVLTVHYEALCAKPASVLTELLAFADLAPDPAVVTAGSFLSRNDKWRTLLSARQQAALNHVLAQSLPRYGYVSV